MTIRVGQSNLISRNYMTVAVFGPREFWTLCWAIISAKQSGGRS
jgi:hypothetical protein